MTIPIRVDSVRDQEREQQLTWLAGYLAVIGAGLLIAMSSFGNLADPFALAFAALACIVVAIAMRPVGGVYLIVFFAVLGDGATMQAYPFTINFSSPQSMLYILDSLTFTPLELCIGITLISWFAHLAGARDWHLRGRPLLWPMLIFGGLVVFGLLYGVGARTGDRNIAIWELRPVLYVVAVFLLVSNLFTRTAQYVKLAWAVVAAITIQNLFAIKAYYGFSPAEREALEGLTDHPLSLFYAWVFLLAMALFLFRNTTRTARILVLLACIPSAWVFVLSQRRAAAVALVAGFALFALIMFFRRRRAAMVLIPVALLVVAGYTAAFWSTTDGIGFGAQAIKTVIAPGEVAEEDAASNLYRDIENYNLVYTIRAEPLFGVGFGDEFYQPNKLPDISFFVFYEYIPHNSLLWIWLKMGYAGIVVLLFTLAAALRAGTRAALRLPSGNTLAVTVAAMAFVVMFMVFAYVDIVWKAQSGVFLGVCLATCANILRLAQNELARGELLDDLVDEPEPDRHPPGLVRA